MIDRQKERKKERRQTERHHERHLGLDFSVLFVSRHNGNNILFGEQRRRRWLRYFYSFTLVSCSFSLIHYFILLHGVQNPPPLVHYDGRPPAVPNIFYFDAAVRSRWKL